MFSPKTNKINYKVNASSTQKTKNSGQTFLVDNRTKNTTEPVAQRAVIRMSKGTIIDSNFINDANSF